MDERDIRTYRPTARGALLVLAAALLLGGCAAGGGNAAPGLPPATAESPEPTASANRGDSSAAAAEAGGTAEAGPREAAAPDPEAGASAENGEPAQTDTEALRNDSGKTMFVSFTGAKDGTRHATVAIVSSQGTVIIADPHAVPAGNGRVPADVITVSHGHPDHNDPTYELGAKEARISKYTAETFTVKDVTVTGVAAAHFDGGISETAPTDVIYVFEVDGLRIAHFGDFGQEKLTDAQLEAIGPIDVAFTRFSDESRYGSSAAKTIALLEQVKPRLMLPTHFEQAVIDEALELLGVTDKAETDKLLLDAEEVRQLEAPRFVMLK